jgi:hypothetical protein
MASSPGVCTTRVPAGQSCRTPQNVTCDDASYCGNDGVCAAKLTPGAACTADYTCPYDKCQAGTCSSQSPAASLALLGYCVL